MLKHQICLLLHILPQQLVMLSHPSALVVMLDHLRAGQVLMAGLVLRAGLVVVFMVRAGMQS